MVSQGCLQEDLHDLHVRGEGLQSRSGRGEERRREQSLCGTRQAHGRLAGDLPAWSLEAWLRSRQPC